MIRPAKRWLHATGANAAIEFALVAPVMLLMTGGIVEFGLAFKVYNSVNRLASQYATTWADCSDFPAGTCGTELSAYGATNAVSNIVPQLVPAQLTLKMFQVQMSGTTPTVVYAYPTGATLNAAQISAAQAAFTNGQAGVVVAVSYTHSLNYFASVMNPYLGSALTPSYIVTQLKS